MRNRSRVLSRDGWLLYVVGLFFLNRGDFRDLSRGGWLVYVVVYSFVTYVVGLFFCDLFFV